MIKLEFSEPQAEVLNYERYNHPHPRVQRKMEALWLKSRWRNLFESLEARRSGGLAVQGNGFRATLLQVGSADQAIRKIGILSR